MKTPQQISSGSLSAFCITILTFISAVTVQECVEKALCVSQWKGTTVLIISVTHQARWCFPQNDQKCSTLLAFKKDLSITLYQFFGKICSSEEVIPKSSVTCVAFFVMHVTVCFSKTKFLILYLRKSENQVQRHVTHYFLRLLMYRNQ